VHFEEARRLLPEAFEAWVGRANCELHAGHRRAAVETLREAARVIPSGAAELESHALFAMQYGDEYRAEEVFDAHRAWARDHASHAVAPPTHTAKSGKVRVGLVAPSFRASAMGFALLPLLQAHDRARFEFVAYSNGDFEDEAAQRVRDACDGWRITPDLDDVAFAQAVHADGIDVLVDLAGHTPGNRLRAFALKPARVQVSWLDYFNTTGLESIDALVVDDTTLATPPQQSFTERLVSAGPVRYPYAAPSYAPLPVARSHAGAAVFGSFARLAKVCPTTMEAWCAVLRAVPGSRLVLKNDSLGDPPLRDEVLASFEARGIDGARIEMRPLSGHQAMLAQYADVDVVLDSLPYNGGITTLEALWMGRPVVTVAGATLIARQAASLLAAAGHPEWVARDAAHFASIAASLVADRGALARLHASLRDEVKRSPLCDGPAFARRFESLLSDLLARAQGST
jgi:protein O-GlcNAc transferase